MLVRGGVDDQPAGLWQARNYAGSIWQHLELIAGIIAREGYKPSDIPKSERKMYFKCQRIKAKVDAEVQAYYAAHPKPPKRDDNEDE